MYTSPSSAGLTLTPNRPSPASNVVTGTRLSLIEAWYGGPSSSDGMRSVTHLPPGSAAPPTSYAIVFEPESSARAPTRADVHTSTSNTLCSPCPWPPPISNLCTLFGSPTVNSMSIWQPWQLNVLAPAKYTARPLTNATSTESGSVNDVVAL